MRKRATSRLPGRRKQGNHTKSPKTRHFEEPHTAICAGLIIVVGLIAYANSFFGVFLYDDYPHIVASETIHELSPLAHLKTRRPLVSLSLAMNHHFGHLNPGGYHAVNLIVHLLAALTLFGVVRRTLSLPRLSQSCGEAAGWLALAVAVLWTVHPLQTESVTYIIQRAESMMGLFYLLTVYCAIRSTDSRRSTSWMIMAIVACASGMLSKAVMVTAPLFVLFFDRTLLSASIVDALRKRWIMYLGLTASWLLLVMVGVVGGVFNPDPTGPASVGFGYKAVTPLEYLATQPGVILHYLCLAFWPRGLCLDYDWQVARTASEIVFSTVPIVAIAVVTIVAAWRRSPAAIMGAWFLLILAPTSSFIPIRNLAFEHRMYLPLAAVVTGAVLCCHRVNVRLGHRATTSKTTYSSILVVLVLATTIALCAATLRHNKLYYSAADMWANVVAQRPENTAAYVSLGAALRTAGKLEGAADAYQRAIKTDPSYSPAHTGLGLTLVDMKRFEEAVGPLKEGLEPGPGEIPIRTGLAFALIHTDRPAEATEQYRKILDLEPNRIDARFNLSLLLGQLEQFKEAEEQFRLLLSIDPAQVSARFKLAGLLMRRQDLEAAIAEFHKCIQLDPSFFDAHYYLGVALQDLDRPDEASVAFQKALAINPNHAPARQALEDLVRRREGQPRGNGSNR